jgi:hypothetical protein
MIGKKFGKLLVNEVIREYGSVAKVVCTCDCGNQATIPASRVTTGNNRSCGCMNNKEARASRKLTHGHRHHDLYKTWNNIIHRCYDEKRKDYRYYGGRGIAVIDDWHYEINGIHPFLAFLRDMGERPSKLHSIDRIDNSKGYSPENCRWATKNEQSRNTRKTVWVHLPGESLILKDFCDLYGFQKDTLPQRARRLGISILDAAVQIYAANKSSITTP